MSEAWTARTRLASHQCHIATVDPWVGRVSPRSFELRDLADVGGCHLEHWQSERVRDPLVVEYLPRGDIVYVYLTQACHSSIPDFSWEWGVASNPAMILRRDQEVLANNGHPQ